ncbi:WD repeat-containing protein slp1-like [Mizuhopecten yessoensis]|uniref:WD repeat-containing protein slp1 n=1 Tax=Mizuhopecten yessoensis TaxID=6573 RepID=A0A210PUC3_MIZYE|nr:WD repeat-containing protein slp1-like [Mizuhopecten yessoensis]XP_021375018.1 WD repeat-containing protein slp1-like [Mizuhopecten yessoensis]XP_021375019.1 WD repeat-containing protein slp1-like [Mizuhopecten yessoensis]OWF40099.1 WD repeat-containing protein slp1 [Mizuhopecten yessoensis]
MSRRRLEAAILAGQQIEQGKSWPQQYTGMQIIKEVYFDIDSLGPVYSLQYSYDGESLAVGFGNGAIRLYESRTGEFIKELRKPRYGGLQIMCLRFHTKVHHILLASTADGKVFECNTKDDSIAEVISEKGNEINCLDFDIDGLSFATGGKDLAIRIYDAKTYKILNTYKGFSIKENHSEIDSAGCSMRVFALKYHPEIENIFVTGGWDSHLKIWDDRCVDGQAVVRTIHGPHICGDSLDIKGYEILTGSWRKKDALQIWDYSSGKVKTEVNFELGGCDGSYLYCGQFCDNDVIMAAGSGTKSCEAINRNTGKMVGEVKFDKAVIAMDTVAGGRLFACGGEDKKFVLGALSD